MVLMALFTTFITTPTVVAIYKPARMASSEYKHRTIQRKDANTQLRLLTCFHSSRSIPTLINLLEISRGTGKKGGLRVYAMHLKELSERPSAILMVNKARKNGMPFWNKSQDPKSDQIVVAFDAFEQLSQVSIRPTIAISPLSSMHVDICTSAERKRAAMIVLPFHKHQRIDGHLETSRGELRYVNRRVFEHAPCSVAVLVDRGLGGTAHISASHVDYTITAFFFGGPDDCEALSYGALIAEHPGINLNAVHFVVDSNIVGSTVKVDIDGASSSEARSMDEEFISQFKEKASTQSSIKFEESVVSNEVEAVDVMHKYGRSNLLVVGRMPEGQLAAALIKKRECPELGPIGNLLTSSEFSTTASVLVVQQFRGQLTGMSLRSLREEPATDGEYESS